MGELYLLAGMTISRFAVLETYLVLLFAECLGAPRNVAAAMLQPVRNFTTTLDIIDVVVRHKIETQNASKLAIGLVCAGVSSCTLKPGGGPGWGVRP
jgi:hypothetical protein